MKKTVGITIKIKIENHTYSKEDFKSIERWEDEGGISSRNKKDLALSLNIPIKPGQIFEVLNGDITFENDEVYYLAKLNLLALH